MKPRVLVVDDDSSIRKAACEVLQVEGYTTTTAEHGGPALDQMRASTESLLVLLDITMPYVDGKQVLEAVAADPALASRHRIILVTSADERSTAGRVAVLREQLDVPLVPMPWTVPQLLDVVEAMVARMA